MQRSSSDNLVVFGRRATLALLLLFCHASVHGQETWQNLCADLYGVCMRDANTVMAVGDFGRIMVGAGGGRTWSLRNAPTRDVLTSVAFGDGNTGIVVGYHGTILRTTNGGDTWRRVSDTGTAALTSVCAVSTGEYVAVGSLGRVLRSTDGGSRWSVVPVPSSAILFRVVFRNSRSGIIVGDSGTILRSEDGGASWTKGPIPDPVSLRSCAFIDSLHGIVVGFRGVIDVTVDGGRSWNPGLAMSDIDNLRDVCYLSRDTVIACGFSRGTSKIIRSVDGGRSWTSAEPFGMQKYAGVTALTRDGSGNVLGVGLDNLILLGSDQGASWETISSMPTSTTGPSALVFISQVAWTDSLHLFATGDPGVAGLGGWFYSSTDGGVTWHGTLVDTSDEMTGIISVSSDTLIVASQPNDRRYTSIDGGRSWTNTFFTTFPIQRSFRPGRTQMLTDSIGYTLAIDSLVWRTTDRGTSWYGYPLETRFWHTLPVRESFPTLAIGYAAAQGFDVHDSVVTLNGGIYKSVDSGKTWLSQIDHTIPQMSGIHFRDPLFGVACSRDSGLILRTIDGGERWEMVYANAAIGFNDVRLLDDTLGYVVGADTNGNVILKTTDGGRTWSKVDVGIWSNGIRTGYHYIFSPDNVHMYVPGVNQIIMKWSGAREPSLQVVERSVQPMADETVIVVVPNPIIHETTTIRVRGGRASTSTLDICDVQGHVVAQLRASSFDVDGSRVYFWNTTDIPKGRYFVRSPSNAGSNGASIQVE